MTKQWTIVLAILATCAIGGAGVLIGRAIVTHSVGADGPPAQSQSPMPPSVGAQPAPTATSSSGDSATPPPATYPTMASAAAMLGKIICPTGALQEAGMSGREDGSWFAASGGYFRGDFVYKCMRPDGSFDERGGTTHFWTSNVTFGLESAASQQALTNCNSNPGEGSATNQSPNNEGPVWEVMGMQLPTSAYAQLETQSGGMMECPASVAAKLSGGQDGP
ncbi:hypothetical protein [Nocardioides baekrokdamisoli]|uniref:hypothetical protein n=1 Tax=Nocardioides baekrokdamisoli TaxID=1804624 RepID=UPI000F77914D|nr:hypothetical protein [Nocardioides baekrokdamisoli]